MSAETDLTAASSDWGKTDFGEIYDRPDPSGYFTTLQPLGYQIPHHGQAVFRTLTDTLHARRPEHGPPAVVDLCCSYGINAALLNHEITLDDLYSRYATPRAVAEDRTFFAARRRPGAATVTGIDAAPRAVAYARAAGLLDRAFAENLESGDPSPALRDALAATDLVTVTGGIGYVFTRTFSRLLACMSRPPWIAAFVLRTVPYQPVAELLARSGLVTERLPGRSFRQRRFTDDGERKAAFEALAAQGLGTAGREADGYYHADLYVSRPAADVTELPLTGLL
ncbi:hypothetical protein [Streptomyces sp. NPDC002537]